MPKVFSIIHHQQDRFILLNINTQTNNSNNKSLKLQACNNNNTQYNNKVKFHNSRNKIQILSASPQNNSYNRIMIHHMKDI